jgi:hypothetical protein
MRAIRDDNTLNVTQKAVLLCAVLRTNEAGKVKASQEVLMEDAGVTPATFYRHMTPEVVGRYFLTEKVNARVRNWFLVSQPETHPVSQYETQETDTQAAPVSQYETQEVVPVSQSESSVSQIETPSTSSSTNIKDVVVHTPTLEVVEPTLKENDNVKTLRERREEGIRPTYLPFGAVVGDAEQLFFYFSLKYKSKTGSQLLESWSNNKAAFADLLGLCTLERGKQLVDYYFSLTRNTYKPIDFCRSWEALHKAEAAKAYEGEDSARKRAESAKRVEAYKARQAELAAQREAS